MNRLLDAATGVLVLCALLVTGLVVRREFFPTVPRPGSPERVADAASYAAAGHRMGPADAAVTIVEFSDFQCPFCRVFAARLDTLRRKYPKDVAVLYRHYPLKGHAHAADAARASDCAARQGRFAAYHDALFAAQDSIGVVPWTRFAVAAAVADTVAFARCTAERGGGQLARDSADARRLGVRGTPTIVIGGTRLVGAVESDTLEAYVRRILSARSRGRLSVPSPARPSGGSSPGTTDLLEVDG